LKTKMPPKHFKKKGGGKNLNDFDSIQGILFTCNSARQREAVQEALGIVEKVRLLSSSSELCF